LQPDAARSSATAGVMKILRMTKALCLRGVTLLWRLWFI
jgi:hypothetical protein